jgi:hypothetical protein
MAGYLDLFTPETWQAFTSKGGEITGFRASQRKSASKIEVGDRFLCYLVKLQRWVGVLEATSTSFEDSTPLRSVSPEAWRRYRLEMLPSSLRS